VATPVIADTDVSLLLPDIDEPEPELSIVIPALNEELTVGDFVSWCHEGLADAGVRGEIVIVDSGSDRTTEIALAHGARVLRTPKRGLGRAYIDAIPFIRGRWVLMGDADCTYDFRRLKPFVERFREGYEFVMGSRWKGTIEADSMPWLHQKIGTPATTWILNRVYSSHFSDIHCGMRGITLDALSRIEMQSQSWEYASEMVLKSVHLDLRTAEVPVTFLKDREGRLSHHKRSGWFSPFSAAWINLRAMFVHGADFFLLKPGFVMLALGLPLLLALLGGPFSIGDFTFSLHWMLVGAALTIIGLQSVLLGGVAQVLYDYTGAARARWLGLFRYTRSVFVAVASVLVGLGLCVPLVGAWATNDFKLRDDISPLDHLALGGITLVVCGFTVFTSTLILHAVDQHARHTEHIHRAH
jgi:glycosyltransferase involved in cell wall biosynthesis